jgi:hypothetical protein
VRATRGQGHHFLVNAGEKMHRRAGARLHHRWTGSFKQPKGVVLNSAFQFD